MTKRALSQGTLRRDPYDELHPALPKRKSRHLKYEDLTKLMATQLDQPNLQRVRDWFIFSTFTGLAYADLKRLSERISYRRRTEVSGFVSGEKNGCRLLCPVAGYSLADYREIQAGTA